MFCDYRTVECCIAIMAGCVPATYAFWSKYVTTSSFYTKIRSGLSSLSSPSRIWPRSTQQNSKLPSREGSQHNGDHIYDGGPSFVDPEQSYKMEVQVKANSLGARAKDFNVDVQLREGPAHSNV